MLDKNPWYTTGKISAMLHISDKLIRGWCKTQLLQAHRVPGSSHFRVTHKNLVAFLRQNELGELIKNLQAPRPVCLLLGLDEKRQGLEAALGASWTVLQVGNFFGLGLLVAQERPSAVVLDFAFHRTGCVITAERLRQVWPVVVVGLSCDDEGALSKPGSAFDAVLPREVAPRELAQVILQEVG